MLKNTYLKSVQLFQTVFDRDGINGVCTFLSYYYNNLTQDGESINAWYPANKSPVGMDDLVYFDKPITPEYIKQILFDTNDNAYNPLNYMTRIQSIDAALTSIDSFINDFRGELASIKSNEETANLYFAKKLDTEGKVTDAMRDRAKQRLKECGFTDDDIKNHIISSLRI